MIYTIYKKSNGEIVSQFGGTLELLQLNLNSETQDYIEGRYLREDYYIENGALVKITARPETWYEFDYDTKQWVLNQDEAAIAALQKRQKLLSESDWTDTLSAKSRLGDTLYDRWQTYRQALRDITAQPGYPTEIVWPARP